MGSGMEFQSRVTALTFSLHNRPVIIVILLGLFVFHCHNPITFLYSNYLYCVFVYCVLC